MEAVRAAGCAAPAPILPSRAVRIALSIAGSDPTGGAGLQLDLRVFQALGVHGAGVVSALTVQDTAKVHRVLPVFPSVVLEQLRHVLADLRPHAVKLGMLATDDVARAVELGLSGFAAGEAPPRVVDPVLAASDGTPLLERRAWPTLLRLCRGAALVTPNLPEAALLVGRDVSSEQGAEAAARWWLEEVGAEAVLLKGGHREGPPDDLLVRRTGGTTSLDWLRGERVPGGGAHGTGCALAAAVAAELARGAELAAAVAAARAFVAAALRRAVRVGAGARLLVLA